MGFFGPFEEATRSWPRFSTWHSFRERWVWLKQDPFTFGDTCRYWCLRTFFRASPSISAWRMSLFPLVYSPLTLLPCPTDTFYHMPAFHLSRHLRWNDFFCRNVRFQTIPTKICFQNCNLSKSAFTAPSFFSWRVEDLYVDLGTLRFNTCQNSKSRLFLHLFSASQEELRYQFSSFQSL